MFKNLTCGGVKPIHNVPFNPNVLKNNRAVNLKQVTEGDIISFENAIIKKEPLFINRKVSRLLKKLGI